MPCQSHVKVEFIEEGKQYLLYTRREVTRIVAEGEAPPSLTSR
ncbi:MAG: hypothetical protein AB1305_06195 [Candidatus Hadarchaeota archaeon]